MLKQTKRKTRHLKVRKKVKGSNIKPRLVVFRSNKNMYAQIIDDEQAKTLVSVCSGKIKPTKENEIQTKKMGQAAAAGEKLAENAIKKKITKIVFDRGGYKYHGRVKALAEGARKGGLKF